MKKQKLYYIFPCPQYPKGYICEYIGYIKEYFPAFRINVEQKKGRCILSNNEIYLNNNKFMWLKGTKKHNIILESWKKRIK